MNKTLEDPIPKTNAERNRWKKAKYKQKKMQKKSTTATRKPYKIDKKPRMKRQWTWTIKSSKPIKLQHKRALLSIHQLSNIKEQNLANIHNLQTLLVSTIFKNKHSVITSTTTSSSGNTENVLYSIQTLRNKNLSIDKRISSIQKSTNNSFNTSIKRITNLNSNHGYTLQKSINILRNQQRSYNNLIKQRLCLQPDNLAQALQTQEKSKRKLQTEQEKAKLSNTDKIHNFTNIQQPPDFTQLHHKGTNFIPTTDQSTPSSIAKTISSGVNSALCNLIKSSASTLYHYQSCQTAQRTSNHT